MSWALVTGGGKRLGREIALHLAQKGWDIHLHYHHSEIEARETAREISNLGKNCLLHGADLSQPREVENLLKNLKATGENNHAPTLVINSASGWDSSTWELAAPEDFQKQFQVTALAPFILARDCIKNQPQGLVVNILDARMEDYDKNHLAYHLAKRSLASFTRVLALEGAPGWRANALAPGLILKPETMAREAWENLASTNPLGALGSPQDLLRTLDYFWESPFVTGQVIFLDGGRFLKGGFYGF